MRRPDLVSAILEESAQNLLAKCCAAESKCDEEGMPYWMNGVLPRPGFSRKPYQQVCRQRLAVVDRSG